MRKATSSLGRVVPGVVAVAVAAAIGLGVPASGPDGAADQTAAGRFLPTWALPWPDHRDGSVPQRVLDGAVLAFRHRMGQRTWDGNGPEVLAEPKAVVWYAGQLVAGGRLVVVAFEADTQEGRRLVAGYAAADDVMQGGPGWQSTGPGASESPWILHDVPAPAPRPGLTLGINANVPDDTALAGGQPADPLSGDWVVQLASADVTAMSWRVPVGWPPAAQEVRARARRGMAVAQVGDVTGAITLTSVTAGRRNLQRNLLVGLPGSADSAVPQLAWPSPELDGASSSESGQGPSATNLGAGRSVITVICYGPSPVTLRVSSTGPDILLGRIRCDDQPHSLTRRGGPAEIFWRASLLTAWTVKTAGAYPTSPPPATSP